MDIFLLYDLIFFSGRPKRSVSTLIRPYHFTNYDKQYFVDQHNKHRRDEGASDMKMMTWDDEIAEVAQSWVR